MSLTARSARKSFSAPRSCSQKASITYLITQLRSSRGLRETDRGGAQTALSLGIRPARVASCSGADERDDVDGEEECAGVWVGRREEGEEVEYGSCVGAGLN